MLKYEVKGFGGCDNHGELICGCVLNTFLYYLKSQAVVYCQMLFLCHVCHLLYTSLALLVLYMC